MNNILRIVVAVLFIMLMAITAVAQQTYTSMGSGNWSTMTWSPAGTPGASDNVVIANGHTVVINQNISIANLTVGGGTSGILTFDGTTGREVKVSGNVTIAAGGSFLVYSNTLTPTGNVTLASTTVSNVSSMSGIVVGMAISGNGIPGGALITAVGTPTATDIGISVAATATGTAVPLAIRPAIKDSIYISGNLTNNGTFDMSLESSTTICNVIFDKTTGDQTISGTGAITKFRGITIAKGAVGNRIICTANVQVGGSFPLCVAGTWEQSAGRFNTSGTINIGTAAATACAFKFTNSGSARILGNINVYGTLLVNTTDSVIVGTGAQKIDHTFVVGAVATYTSGTVLIYGKFANSAQCATTINGANIVIDPKAATASDYAFRSTTGTGGVTPLTFTSGTVTILNPNGAASAQPELALSSSVAPNISGTAIFILGQGAGTVASTAGYRISLNSVGLLNHVVLNTGSVGVTLQSNVTVKGTLTLKSSGALSLGTPTPFVLKYGAGGTLVYNGTAAQTTSDFEFPGADTSKPTNLTINNAAGVTLHASRAITGAFTQTSGTLALNGNTFTFGTGTAVDGPSLEQPREFALSQNYPNPFNPTTHIDFRVEQAGFVSLKVFDVLGREVATLVNEAKSPGTYQATWNASGFGSGLYLCKMQTGTFTETRPMILAK